MEKNGAEGENRWLEQKNALQEYKIKGNSYLLNKSARIHIL